MILIMILVYDMHRMNSITFLNDAQSIDTRMMTAITNGI